MRKLIALVALFLVIGSQVAAQDRRYRHRTHRPIYRTPVYRPVYPTYPQRRAVKVLVFVDAFGRVIGTDTNFTDNLYVSERYLVEADRRARNRYFRPTGRNHRKTVYIYFSY
jgi:hypothetical protein